MVDGLVGLASHGDAILAVMRALGEVELASESVQDFLLFQSDDVIEVSAEPGATPGTIKLLLTLQRPVYHWDRDVDIRFLPLGDVDMGYPVSGWFPHVVLRVPVAWNGCDAFNPVTDSQARVVVQGWSALARRSWYPDGPLLSPARWLHSLALRVVDYAAPYDAFDCLWGHIRMTWPNGTAQTQSLLCVPGDIDVPRVFTLSLPPQRAADGERRTGTSLRKQQLVPPGGRQRLRLPARAWPPASPTNPDAMIRLDGSLLPDGLVWADEFAAQGTVSEAAIDTRLNLEQPR